MGKRVTTTKNGCQTCKARKVKCDQERPSCKRCTSKGRQCGGYGIWSDASIIKPHAERIACKTVALSPNLATTILSDCSPSENMAFDWFVTKALSKLPGPFVLKYWNTVLVQACLQDSSVLHAVLALSETHRGKSERNVAQADIALKHYAIAIRRLQARLQTPNECNSTVTMISCLAFVNLELLRSNFVSALIHLRSGLRILEESSFVLRRSHQLALAPKATPVEEAIFRAFARINVLVALQDRQSHECHIVTQREKDEPMEFTDLPSAWLNLEEILNQTSSLLHGRQAVDCPVLEVELSRLRWRLASWWMSFDALVPVPDSDLCHVVLYHLLHNWGTMTAVMIESTQFEDEADFDQFHSSFETIIHHATISRELRLPSTPLPTKTKQGFNMSHSLVDVGWIPPLYFTAVKCRDYKLRRRAIELIESATHREGIWDSIISASIARAVVAIEHHESEETSTPAACSQFLDRIVDLRVVLPDSPCRSVVLHYRPKSDGWMTRTLDCVS